MTKHGRRRRLDPNHLPLADADRYPDAAPVTYCPVNNKRQFANEIEAERVAAHQMSIGAPPLSVYFCVYCQHYHLTRD